MSKPHVRSDGNPKDNREVGSPRQRVLIVGGGIGGLTLALSLHQLNIPCAVFEAATDIKELGVGINILPHAARALKPLGVLEELDEIAIRTRRLRYLNHLGQEILRSECGLWGGHDMPQLSIHRGRLHGVLWRAAQARLPVGAVRTGHRLLNFLQDAEGVTARFTLADGSQVEEPGQILIGADGIHSAVRGLLHPEDGGLRWQGSQLWRGVVDWPVFEGGNVMLIAADGLAKLTIYPIGEGRSPRTRLTNWVMNGKVGGGAFPPRREDWSRQGKLEEVLPFAKRLRLPFLDLEALIRATPRFFEYPECDRDPLPWWTQGRVTLLGDAAHPMYPSGSNGAAQSILDARCLAKLLSALPLEAALKAYEAERRPKTAEVVRTNRRGGPERVLNLVAERAPEGFTRLDDVITSAELTDIVGGYAQLVGLAGSR
ncbi:flavin-dependent oxidoreductase [Dongia soli]|uniref:Flavin-dependent oxidoreductase n=1 Tax=Dongia soli TaxID=600628 RepID=A0ABU5EGB4_9PROT|nr:flavin-dependent oxidoreductase [Dongia soli]MDY0885282.1 flavin-dependent oxidoreductase [Dongia soli]